MNVKGGGDDSVLVAATVAALDRGDKVIWLASARLVERMQQAAADVQIGHPGAEHLVPTKSPERLSYDGALKYFWMPADGDILSESFGFFGT